MKRSTLFHVLFATAFSVVFICPALARQGTKMAPDAKTMTIEGAVSGPRLSSPKSGWDRQELQLDDGDRRSD